MYRTGSAAIAALLLASSAAAVPLSFDTLAPGQTNGPTSLFGSPTVEGLSVDFLNVATEFGTTVDARVTATVKPQTSFGTSSSTTNGFPNTFIYDYANANTEPSDDLGFIYQGQGVNSTENGIELSFQFFDGTGAKSGMFQETLTLQEIEIAVYDVDGESAQSEFFRAFTGDGLVSYGLGTTPQALQATYEGNGTFRFDGPGMDFAEDDASGAALLTYANTDFFRLSFGSVQTASPNRNGVFSAVDGDLSLFDPNDFNVSPVPLPAGGVLLLSALGAMAWRGRRRQAAAEA
ncbi:MAG: VPLPA-CTERM sorting domain-containing protein [Pseudomonadota bacterium]